MSTNHRLQIVLQTFLAALGRGGRAGLLITCLGLGACRMPDPPRAAASRAADLQGPVETNSFYLPANRSYSIVQSALDSARFTTEKTLRRDERQHLVSISSFVNTNAEIMAWHDFGNLEGPGWAANAAGGGLELYRLGKFLNDGKLREQALAILDHVLDCGFVEEESGFIRGYRETTTGKFCLNYKHNSDWFCPGSMAKVGFQFLLWADELGGDARAARLRRLATSGAAWIHQHVAPVPNGWFPRRTTPSGAVYRRSPDGGDDTYWQSSADSLFILQLQAALTERGLADFRSELKAKLQVFLQAGGIFGSINHDTYDPHENVAYSVAFRTLQLCGRVLEDKAIREFAYERCLGGLDQFKMTDNRNGVATKGLLFMEKSWDTAYLWENAEAALAFFEAAADLRDSNPARAQQYELEGLTILRAIAQHQYGPYGFLTEGVDWNNHVGQQHHIAQAQFGAIQYTEPFLNNLHILEPTLFYLEKLASKSGSPSRLAWRDREGNVLWKQGQQWF